MSANLVWMDLEMTGLNPRIERIIEIATIVTDSELNTIAEGPVLAAPASESAEDSESVPRAPSQRDSSRP